MWKIIEIAVYFVTIALCIYQFSTVVPVVMGEVQKIVHVQGVSTPDTEDISKILELGPWGIVLILCVKLVVDYFNKSREQQLCNTKIKNMEDNICTTLKELRGCIERGIERGIDEGHDAISESRERIEKETTEIRTVSDRIDKQINRISMKTDEMYNWHNLNDESGAKVWYIRKSLYDSLEKLVDVQRSQNEILRNQQTILSQILKDVENKS
jgi:hypothetical protein